MSPDGFRDKGARLAQWEHGQGADGARQVDTLSVESNGVWVRRRENPAHGVTLGIAYEGNVVASPATSRPKRCATPAKTTPTPDAGIASAPVVRHALNRPPVLCGGSHPRPSWRRGKSDRLIQMYTATASRSIPRDQWTPKLHARVVAELQRIAQQKRAERAAEAHTA